MPVEFAHVEHETGNDQDHSIFYTDTKGIAFLFKAMDPINFGYDNKRLFFFDGDFAFGISSAEAEELKDDVYGFQFNTEINAGVKKGIDIGYALFAIKLGYRVFFDAQILSESDSSDEENTTSTLRNFFHGPFLTIIGSF